jgi:hypothetical protein
MARQFLDGKRRDASHGEVVAERVAKDVQRPRHIEPGPRLRCGHPAPHRLLGHRRPILAVEDPLAPQVAGTYER